MAVAYLDQISLRLRNATKFGEPATISLLILSFILLLCISLASVAQDAWGPIFHIGFAPGNMVFAGLSVAAFSCCAFLFASARFSIGFVASFYLLAVATGYLWLSYFTPLDYNHAVVRVSVVASFLAFAFPALFITRPLPRRELLTHQQMELLLYCLMFSSALTAAYGSLFGFHWVGIAKAEAIRGTLSYPTWMNYAIPISTTTALPFAYAWFVTQKRYAIAAIALTILFLFYPITLNKTVLLTPFWLIALTMLLRFVPAKPAAVLSLLAPMLLGLIIHTFELDLSRKIYGVINLRMLAIPASGIDHYAHFFSTHPVTNFCQIQIIGKIFQCTLSDRLAVLMANGYAIGNYNASLLATEGIASVGPYLAPIPVLLCGMVFAVGNMASARLDQAFIFLSGSVLAQAVMNIPLSTLMLTHGGVVMLVLWFIAPTGSRSSAQF
jgi:hypothetical protein